MTKRLWIHLLLLDLLCGNIMAFWLKTVQQPNLKLPAKFAQQLSSIIPVQLQAWAHCHLKRRHSIDDKSEALHSKTVKTSPGTKNSTGTGQLKIQDVMNTLPWSGNRATAITKPIRAFIAKDMRPYSVVENKGFQHMINVLESRYDLISRVHKPCHWTLICCCGRKQMSSNTLFCLSWPKDIYVSLPHQWPVKEFSLLQGTWCLLRGHVCIVNM